MRKLFVYIITLMMIFSLPGCSYLSSFGDKFEPAQFDGMDALKAQLGGQFLYPDALPDGYRPMYTDISGKHYTGTGTWDYDIRFHEYMHDSGGENTELYRRIAEGLPVIVYIQVRSFGPKHRASEQGLRTKRAEIRIYDSLVEESADNVWDIGGVTVAHKAVNASRESIAMTVTGRILIKVRDDLQETLDAYCAYLAYAAFYYDETLYTVELQVDAPPDKTEESMLELCSSMLETVVMGMLHSREAE